MKPYKGVIRDACFYARISRNVKPGEAVVQCRGLRDGGAFHTSIVERVYTKDSKTFVETMNSIYELRFPAAPEEET